jgi:pSer/pThr/pTyr-binding forkhead associated (FHA) protein
MSTSCVLCPDGPATVGLLCLRCSARLTGDRGLLPQHVVSTCDPGVEVVLVDPWGRALPVATLTVIGRLAAPSAITVLDAGVSRAHAQLGWRDGRWRLRDLESSNGTKVNDRPITECELAPGDFLQVASIGFGFARGVASLPSRVVTELGTRKQASLAPATARRDDAPPTPVVILEPTGGGGAVIEIEQARTRLSSHQLELVDVLAKRMFADRERPEPVRGFVRSSELLDILSRDASEPGDSIKQLVRRVRRRLLALGVGDLIEARRGFGYRLRIEPEALRQVFPP